jgi:hypothetical protein
LTKKLKKQNSSKSKKSSSNHQGGSQDDTLVFSLHESDASYQSGDNILTTEPNLLNVKKLEITGISTIKHQSSLPATDVKPIFDTPDNANKSNSGFQDPNQ